MDFQNPLSKTEAQLYFSDQQLFAIIFKGNFKKIASVKPKRKANSLKQNLNSQVLSRV